MIINIHFSDQRTPKYNNVGSTFFHFQSNNEEKRMCGESLNRENHDRHVVNNVDVKQDVVKIEEFEGN